MLKKPSNSNMLVLIVILLVIILLVIAVRQTELFILPKARSTSVTQLELKPQVLPNSGDIVFVFAGADHQGRDFLPLATIIDPHTGVESNCILESRAALQIIGTKADQTRLVVRNEPKQAMSGSCIKGQEIFLDAKIVSYFQERRALKLKIAEVEWELKMLETLPSYLPSRQN